MTFQQRRFHRSQSLGYKNGYAIPARPEVGIGGEPLEVNQLSLAELEELNNKRPTLTYGQAKQAPPEDFIPAHVAFDKKVRGHFKTAVAIVLNNDNRPEPAVLGGQPPVEF